MSRVWLNGRLVPAEKATVSVVDRGFLLGDALFETMRAYGGRVFRLAEHLDRLARGARRIGLPLPDGLADAVAKTLKGNGLVDAAVRLTVTRGPGTGLTPPEDPQPTVVIAARPPSKPPDAVRAAWARGRVNEHSTTAGLKRPAYLDAVVEMAQARAAGYDDVLFLDTAAHLAEGAYSNVFVLARGTLRTPPPTCGILPGITRAAVLEIAAEQGRATAEASLDPPVLDEAEEAFLTSSLREIVPLVSVGGRPIGRGEPGPVTRGIQAAYAALTRAGR
ncbi:MAG: aminotransferase class IV [Gemmatimonadota bacterium]